MSGVAAPMGGMILKSRPGRIPWSAVDRWCRRQGYGREDQDLLWRLLRVMDSEFLAWWTARESKV
ncbi:hypothetical protein [Roseomonas sp. BN140053]|uniref:hypothetical protein n=1 Tax=Roseomonas sp. BN140053 TaxID=3391898 RepID=UPI0039EA4D45